jgi:hypothetical protein
MMKARFRSLAGPVHELPPYQQKQQVESIARHAGGADGRARPRHHTLRLGDESGEGFPRTRRLTMVLVAAVNIFNRAATDGA